MTSTSKPDSSWGSSYRLVASEKWKAKSATMGRPLTEALVEYAQPQPGMQVLDIASGTGEPAISIAEHLQGTGRVVGLDLSSELLDIAKKRAQQRGLTNISFHEGDAQALPFEDDGFDLGTCRCGVMFFKDADKALRELERVLRPSARAYFAAWGPFEQPYWQSMMNTVHKHVGGPLIPPGGQDPFRFASPGSLSSALGRAGFQHIEEETRTIGWFWPGEPEEVWEYSQSVSAPFRAMLDRVPNEAWPKINQEVLHELRKYQRDGGIDFGAQVVFASGQKAQP